VELSTVDESSLESAVNAAVGEGWTLENVQFAMRDASKRPAMAFIFFTRQATVSHHDTEAAASRLRALAHGSRNDAPSTGWDRLRELADDGDAR